MRKEDLYEIVKNFVKTRKEDPYAYFTASLRMRKFKISCCVCRTQNTYGTLKGRYQVNLQEKINHNQNFSEFSETEAINLKKVASYFQDTIHFHPVHLQPKTLNFTIRALVE